MNDADTFRCAKLLLDRHGRNAEFHAALRADEFEAAGDHAGHRIWVRILAAIDELGRLVPDADERMH